MTRQLIRCLSLLTTIIFVILGQAGLVENKIFAATLSNYENIYSNNLMSNLKIITGEKLVNVQEGSNVYKAEICNNSHDINIQFAVGDGSFGVRYLKPNEYIVTGPDNTIVGSISEEEPILRIDNLKDGLNTITIRKKADNTELYKLYINYKNVQISGLKSIVNTGDKFNLYASIDGKVSNHVKWTSAGINSVMISEDGEITAINNGIATIIATIYDEKNKNIIGNINLEFNICGDAKLGWINNSGRWYYVDKKTNSFTIGWLFENGDWYYLDNYGELKTGWIYKNENWYYLRSDGKMATGWIKDNGKWYLLNEEGIMKVGWIKDHGNWYYLNSNGSMETKFKEIDGKIYYFNTFGELQTIK